MGLNLDGFKGAVFLKEWVMTPTGNNCIAVVGNIKILEAKKAAGFDPGNREANWVARVESADGSKSFNILGCQIRAIYQGEDVAEKTTSNTWVM